LPVASVPFQRWTLSASKIPGTQAAYECCPVPTVSPAPARVARRRMARRRSVDRLRSSYGRDQCDGHVRQGTDLSENGQAIDAIRDNGPGQHFLGTAHTFANFETAFYRSNVADNSSFDQWTEDGATDAPTRANAVWKKRLAEYEMPPMDDAIAEELTEFVARRKQELPDEFA
jgi:trimethylamine--corrinoid protein Co-methyltransferase